MVSYHGRVMGFFAFRFSLLPNSCAYYLPCSKFPARKGATAQNRCSGYLLPSGIAVTTNRHLGQPRVRCRGYPLPLLLSRRISLAAGCSGSVANMKPWGSTASRISLGNGNRG